MNGQWDFAFDDENIGVLEGWSHTVRGDRKINVPFTYETGKSGIGDERPHGVIWYWKNITITNEFKKDQSIQINFEGYVPLAVCSSFQTTKVPSFSIFTCIP